MVSEIKQLAYGLQIVKDLDLKDFLHAVMNKVVKKGDNPDAVYFILGDIQRYMAECFPTLTFTTLNDGNRLGYMIYVTSTLYKVGEDNAAVYLPPTRQEQLELEACKKALAINGEISAIRWSRMPN